MWDQVGGTGARDDAAARVIGEEEGRIYLYKPAGVPVFPMRRGPDRGSVLEAFLAERPDQGRWGWPEGFEGGIAHRLDNSTSGLLVAATSPEALASLRGDFAAKRLAKHYRFRTDRDVPWDRHTVSVELAHDPRRGARMVARRGRDTPHRGSWLPAETILSRRGPGSWEAVLHTGVMHQVRLHAAIVGLALTGDRLYGGRPWPEGAGPPEGVDFLLHHVGLEAPGWRTPRVSAPGWWG